VTKASGKPFAIFAVHLQNVDVMSEPVEECGCHLGMAEGARPFAKGRIGRDDDRGALLGVLVT